MIVPSGTYALTFLLVSVTPAGMSMGSSTTLTAAGLVRSGVGTASEASVRVTWDGSRMYCVGSSGSFSTRTSYAWIMLTRLVDAGVGARGIMAVLSSLCSVSVWALKRSGLLLDWTWLIAFQISTASNIETTFQPMLRVNISCQVISVARCLGLQACISRLGVQ